MKQWARWALADRFVGRALAVAMIIGFYALFFMLYALAMPPVLP
ncbi:MAG: hypothetical protein JWO85_579 [Candidatus Eremiobacteraeota bacterium]|nr:hypothetical protein [Candidatus Eremiobacteraeota bacterium]